MTSTSITIANYKTSMPTSKFAPKEQVVSILPSIDDCLSLLPRSVGNHILSYTTAWYDFYLENLIKKYGYKFVIITLNSIFHFHIKASLKYDVSLFNHIDKHSKRLRQINRTLILQTFNQAILKREQHYIEWKALQVSKRLNTKQRQQVWFNKIEVGDIISNEYNISSLNEYHLILEKTKSTYYSIEIKIQQYPFSPPPQPALTQEEQTALTQEELAFQIWCNLNPSTGETEEEPPIDTNTYLVSLQLTSWGTINFIRTIDRNMLFDYQNSYGVRQLERRPVRVVYTKFTQGVKHSRIKLMSEFTSKENFMGFNLYKQERKTLKYYSV